MIARPPGTAWPTDAELMRRMQHDDVDALGGLFDRYARQAHGLARTLCHQPAVAEDVVQEAFISIWRSRSTYRPMDVDVGAWAMSIVRHRAIDALRRDHRHNRRRADTEALKRRATSEDVEADACARDEAQHLRELLGRLPEAQRDVIALSFFTDLTHVEIAARLEIPLGTVKGRMRLGLRKLRADV